MCFSIPLKVKKVEGSIALLEGGKTVRLGKELSVKPGEYLRVTGNIAVGKLSKIEGQKIRRLIKSLNK